MHLPSHAESTLNLKAIHSKHLGKLLSAIQHSNVYTYLQAAEIVWQDSGKFVATNSAVARTCILGVHQHDTLGQVIKNTLDVCRVTHQDPR